MRLLVRDGFRASWIKRPSSLHRGWTAHLRVPSWPRTLLTQSIARGPVTPPLLHRTTGDHLEHIARTHGDSLAVVSSHQHVRLSYDELHSQSTALAHGLRQQGVSKGDRVCVMLGNNIEHAMLTYAIFKLGAILVPLNAAFNASQVISALNHLQATHLVISLETLHPRQPPRSNIPLLRQLVPSLHESTTCDSELVPSLHAIITVDNAGGRIDVQSLKAASHFQDVLSSGNGCPSELAVSLDPDEVCNIQFTSGTTAMPKAAMLSHKSILNNGKSIGDRLLLTERDVVCCPPPLFHCFGCILGYMATVTHGSAIVFPSECFDPLATLRAVQDEKCTALYGVPTMFISELELLEKGIVPHEGFEHLRTGIGAGTNIPAELMRKLHRTLNLTELTICYGQTETSPVSAMTTTDDPLEKRIETVGRLMPHVEAKVVSAKDRTKILPIGMRGELAVAGYSLQKGYWNDQARTDEVMIRDEQGKRWIYSGDEAEMDAEGYIKITGRLKDLIIRGGENIHPLEIENCLLAHPGILDVSVVGLPDPRYGEVVAAFIIPKASGPVPTADDVRAWVLPRLSHHLVPKYVFPAETFPKTASGKVQKFVLRELGQKRRAEAEQAAAAAAAGLLAGIQAGLERPGPN